VVAVLLLVDAAVGLAVGLAVNNLFCSLSHGGSVSKVTSFAAYRLSNGH